MCKIDLLIGTLLLIVGIFFGKFVKFFTNFLINVIIKLIKHENFFKKNTGQENKNHNPIEKFYYIS